MKIKRLIKIVIINFILFLFIIPKSFTKPIPPGTGEGDVPANILILLDSSVSMRNIVSGGEGTYGCLLYTSPSPRDSDSSRMPSSA